MKILPERPVTSKLRSVDFDMNEQSGLVENPSTLSAAIDFIDSNLIYGRAIEWGVFRRILAEFKIQDEEQKRIFQELESLHITVRFPQSVINAAFRRLIPPEGLPNNEIRSTSFEKWIEQEHLYDKSLQVFLLKIIHNMGFHVVEEIVDDQTIKTETDTSDDPVSKEPENKTFVHEDADVGSLPDLEDEFGDLGDDDLDEMLESNEFQYFSEHLEVVADRSNNLILVSKYQSDDVENRSEYLNKLVIANQRLVWKEVSRRSRQATISCTEEDMFQAGCMGLMRAVEKFDFDEETQLSTYATWWIRQAITRAIANTSTTIRIPVHMRERQMKMIRTSRELLVKLGREASIHEIAVAMDEEDRKIQELADLLQFSNLSSLDAPIDQEGGASLGDFLGNEDNVVSPYGDPVNEAEDAEAKQELWDYLEVLDYRGRAIVINRYGLDGEDPKTLDEIGRMWSLTRERVRQIVRDSLQMLHRVANEEKVSIKFL
jgi:RNA polymerase primary sigma factor